MGLPDGLCSIQIHITDKPLKIFSEFLPSTCKEITCEPNRFGCLFLIYRLVFKVPLTYIIKKGMKQWNDRWGLSL